MALKPASGYELWLYIVVVAYLQVVIYLQGVSLSDEAAASIIRTAGTAALPARLTSILHTQPRYTHWLAQQQEAQEARREGVGGSGSSSGAIHVSAWSGAWALFTSWPRARDVSDVQWQAFRSSLGLLTAGLAAFVAVSRLAQRLGPRVRVGWYLVGSAAFLAVLHGAQAVWPLALSVASYALAQVVAGRRYGLVVVWGWHITTFIVVRATNGIPFALLSPSLAWLDHHHGMLRWHIHYNLLMLRLLSFACDLHWARRAGQQGADAGAREGEETAEGEGEGKGAQAGGGHAGARQRAEMMGRAAGRGVGRPGEAEAKARIETPLPLPQYSLAHHTAYCLYPPLYIAGPTMTYNNFVSQLVARPRLGGWQVVQYILRWVGALGVLELMTHTLYVNAITKHGLLTRGALAAGAQPLYFALSGFWVLVFMWLKFLVIWRLMRAAALCDGVDPPENMGRCVCNNYDVAGFWRSWHSSYNRWLVRYMYVPLGGAAWRALNVWPTFLFVALWHDLEPRLLHWGLLMPAVFLPEMVVKAIAEHPAVAVWAHHWAYRHAAAALATVNILGLMCVNLAGFVVGVEGVVPLVRQVLGQPRMACAVVVALFSAAQIMFALRGRERRVAERAAAVAARERGDQGGGGGNGGEDVRGMGPILSTGRGPALTGGRVVMRGLSWGRQRLAEAEEGRHGVVLMGDGGSRHKLS